MPEPVIVVPDDFPSIFKGTPAEQRCARLGEIRVFSERGADAETELSRRLDGASVAINIRAHAHFTDQVFAACPQLKLVSIWGTGTPTSFAAASISRSLSDWPVFSRCCHSASCSFGGIRIVDSVEPLE